MQLPVTITSINGERLTFVRIITDQQGKEILEVENEIAPNAGPPMHVHYLQDEWLAVVEGKIGYQELGKEKRYGGPGDSVLFKAGVAHRFWNAGSTPLRCTGWVSPPHNIVYFLSEIYKSSNANNGRPGAFDAAYLLDRYKTEFAMLNIPPFVQKVIFPATLMLGKLRGQHKKFTGAPKPIRQTVI